MKPSPRLNFRPYLVASVILFIFGAVFFALAVLALEPSIWPKWLFFFGGSLALIGLALPVAWFLNLRFPSEPPAGASVILRQAGWVGVFGGLVAWLQQERLASLGIIAALAVGLFIIEYLIRLRERSLWRPPKVDEEPPENDQPA